MFAAMLWWLGTLYVCVLLVMGGAVALLSLTPEETVRIMEQDVPR